jgi:hypothetical protein
VVDHEHFILDFQRFGCEDSVRGSAYCLEERCDEQVLYFTNENPLTSLLFKSLRNI